MVVSAEIKSAKCSVQQNVIMHEWEDEWKKFSSDNLYPLSQKPSFQILTQHE